MERPRRRSRAARREREDSGSLGSVQQIPDDELQRAPPLPSRDTLEDTGKLTALLVASLLR